MEFEPAAAGGQAKMKPQCYSGLPRMERFFTTGCRAVAVDRFVEKRATVRFVPATEWHWQIGLWLSETQFVS